MRTAVARKAGGASGKRADRSAIAASTKRRTSLAEAAERFEPEVERALAAIRKQPRLARVIVTRDLGFCPSTDLLEAFVRLSAVEKRRAAGTAAARRMLVLWALGRHLSRRLLETGRPRPEALQADETLAADLLAAAEELEARRPARVRADRELLLDVASCVADDLAVLAAAVQVSRGLRVVLDRVRSAKKRAVPEGFESDEVDEVVRVVTDEADQGWIGSRTRLNAIALRVLLASSLAPARRAAKDNAGARAALDAWPVIAVQLREQRDAAVSAGLSEFAGELRRCRQRLYATQLEVRRALDRANASGGSARSSRRSR